MSTLEEEPISTLSEPLPLPPYEIDASFSEDENMLTLVTILARHSSSKKGHMGTIFVRPPESGNPSEVKSLCMPEYTSRIAAYANNTPILYSKNPKAVPEIHAEALAISRSAARGISLRGCTVYISFPPCNECFKLLIASGIKRCVYRKAIYVGEGQGDAVLVAAEVHGIEMVGTLDRMNMCKQLEDTEGTVEAKREERVADDERDSRLRIFWEKQGEDAAKTRARVTRWWDNWMQRYRAAEKVVHTRWAVKGGRSIGKGKPTTNGDAELQVDLDEIINHDAASNVVPSKRTGGEDVAGPDPKEAKVEDKS